MTTISKLQPGQVVYSIERQKIGNTTVRRGVLYKVEIKEVDPEGQFVIASWNGNPARRFGLATVKKWRVNKPEPKGTVLGFPNYR